MDYSVLLSFSYCYFLLNSSYSKAELERRIVQIQFIRVNSSFFSNWRVRSVELALQSVTNGLI